MAKETMQAVSEAEKSANQTVLHAGEESERLLEEAREQGKKLIADAKKEAAKKVEVLCGVARADAAKKKASFAQETKEEMARLEKAAEAAFPQAAQEIRKIVLGQSERR